MTPEEKRLNKKPNRRITVEVTPALYARLTGAKLYTNKSLTKLANEAFAMIADHYAAEREQRRNTRTD